VTASTGTNDVSSIANWSTVALPAIGDDALLDSPVDLLYGLSSLSVPVALASLRIKATATNIGLPRVNAAGYVEDRTRTFPVATTVPVTIGEGDGTGPTLVNLSCGAALGLTVVKTGTRSGNSSAPVVNVSGCSSGTLTLVSGDVGLAADDDTLAAAVTTATIGGGTLTIGKGATVTTLNQKGGTVVNYGTVGTVNGFEGTFVNYGTISTAVNADPAGKFLFDWRSGGTIPTVTFRGQGPGQSAPILECSNDPRAKTITNHTFTGGAALNDPDGTTVWSNAGTWDEASLTASDIGARFTLLRT
jgi:hypothetical protein